MSSNDVAELERLNRTYRPALLAFFLRRLRNHAEAEDLTQDVLIRLTRAERGEIRSADNYIFRTAANLLRDRARREKVRFAYRASVTADPEIGLDDLNPERVLEGRQALLAIEEALRELPEQTRSVFVLYRIEHVEKRLIADAYRLSISAVDRHLAKAMAHLIARVREAPQ